MGETPELLNAVDTASVTQVADVLGTTAPVLLTSGYGDDKGHGEYDDAERIGDDSINVLNDVDVEVEVLSEILSDIANDACVICN